MTHAFLSLRKALLDAEYASLNAPQREAVYYCDSPLLILAGAGSGKTTVLVNKLGYLIKYGNAYHSQTVPENLTRDDLEYLQGALDNPARRSEPRYLRLMAVDAFDPYNLLAITFTNKAAGEMRERMEKKFNVDASALWALTFHATCVRILRRFGDRLGYTNDFTIYDDADSNKLTERILKDMNADRESFRKIGLTFEEKAFYDILMALRDEYNYMVISPARFLLNRASICLRFMP